MNTSLNVSSSKDNKTVLILNIIEEHFGDVVREVAEAMLLSEHCTLALIVRALNSPEDGKKVDVATIRQAMVILLHHNCLIVELASDGDDDSGTHLTLEEKAKSLGLLYRLNVDNIINRLRFCSLLKIVNEKFSPGDKQAGDIAVLIVEEVILHGRVRLPQIRQAVTQTMVASGKATENIHVVVQETFEQLVQNRFIISVPPLDIKKRSVQPVESGKTRAKNSVFNNAAPAPATSKKTTAASLTSSAVGRAKRSRAAVDAELEDEGELLPVEMRMLAAASGAAAEEPASKSIKVEEGAGGRGGRGAGGRLGGRLGGRGGRGGRGAGLTRSDSNNDLTATNLDAPAKGGGAGVNAVVSSVVREDKMWMVCWDQLIREERHAACRQVTTDRMEGLAGHVVGVLLEGSMNSEMGPQQAKSAPMSVREILTRVNKRLRANGASATAASSSSSSRKAAGVDLDETGLKKLLEVMRLSATSLLVKAVGSDGAEEGPSYMVNMEGIVQLLVRKTIHNIAVSRYGEISGRIVELLQRSKYVDQQAVSDQIILPARETRERLYKLFADKWIGYLEMSKRGDFNPSSNYYFWYLDLPRLTVAVLDHLYRAIFNLRLRRASEVAKGKQLLDFAITNEADELKYKALVTRLNMLDDAVVKLDKTVMVLEKF